jgi:hypothetical protein
MISAELVNPALKALQRLIIQAKIQAYEEAGDDLAQFLDDFELVPEYLADDADRTEEFLVTLRGLVQKYPSSHRPAF